MVKYTNEPLSGSEAYFHTPTPQARNSFLYPICLGEYFCDSSYRVSRTSFDSFLLMLVKEGTGYVRTPDFESPVSAGQAVLIDCFKPHTYGAGHSMTFEWIHFDGPTARGYFDYLTAGGRFVYTMPPEQFQNTQDVLSQLLDKFSNGHPLREIELAKYLSDLLTALAIVTNSRRKLVTCARISVLPSLTQDLASALTDHQDFTDTQTAMERCVAYMRQHFMEPLTVDSLAARIPFTTWHFIRSFKEAYGLTPHQYLLDLRLDCARFYLRSTAKTIKEIAFSCGFQSENSFCIAFKKQEGITPTCYRNASVD